MLDFKSVWRWPEHILILRMCCVKFSVSVKHFAWPNAHNNAVVCMNVYHTKHFQFSAQFNFFVLFLHWRTVLRMKFAKFCAFIQIIELARNKLKWDFMGKSAVESFTMKKDVKKYTESYLNESTWIRVFFSQSFLFLLVSQLYIPRNTCIVDRRLPSNI